MTKHSALALNSDLSVTELNFRHKFQAIMKIKGSDTNLDCYNIIGLIPKLKPPA